MVRVENVYVLPTMSKPNINTLVRVLIVELMLI